MAVETFLIPIGFVTLLGFLYALALTISQRLLQKTSSDEELISHIEDRLPQLQCAQCGFPGCRPYAEAILQGASTDLCPPGGERTALELADLMGRDPTVPLSTMSTTNAVKIIESECVGCNRCAQVCPVDAIVGAELFTHTVLKKYCTGCELCIPECPVDCIEIVPESATT